MEKVKFFETIKVDGTIEKSFTRMSIAWYFWTICLFGSLWVLYVFGTAILDSSMTIADGGMLLGMFVILQLGWIAPKQLSKVSEVQEFLNALKK